MSRVRVKWLIVVALITLNAFIYFQTRDHGFVSLDDWLYIRDNAAVRAGLTWNSVKWAFTSDYATNWHPLTWLSHMLDIQLFGMNPGPHHLVSVALHCVNTVLLFLLLHAMTGSLGRSGFVAALFGAHPLHVESVAWISERKDVLSTLFWLLMIAAYVGYVRRRSAWRYALVFAAFVAGLMSKPMVVTAPFTLLLLDIWPLRRDPRSEGRPAGPGEVDQSSQVARWWPLVREKLPLFALVPVSIVMTIIAQRHGDAIAGLGEVPIFSRAFNAFLAYGGYLSKAVWPSHLQVYYAYGRDVSVFELAGHASVLMAGSVAAIRFGREYPYLRMGWLWYLGTLVPVIGLVQVGSQAMADRYTYVPLIGIFIIAAWGVTDYVRPHLAAMAAAKRRVLLPATASVLVLVYAIVAHAQTRYWIGSEPLWQHAVDVSPRNFVAHNALGGLFSHAGQSDAALREFEAALEIEPLFVDAQFNYGAELMQRGRLDEAVAAYRNVVRSRPDHVIARKNLAVVLTSQGKLAEAIEHFRRGLEFEPSNPDLHVGLGIALAAQGKIEEALAELNGVLRLNPANADARRALETIRRGR
jgi:tetratricopeptide (TPR) repeat protein